MRSSVMFMQKDHNREMDFRKHRKTMNYTINKWWMLGSPNSAPETTAWRHWGLLNSDDSEHTRSLLVCHSFFCLKHTLLFCLIQFVSFFSLLFSWTNLHLWHLSFCFPVILIFRAPHLCRPTWIALGHSVDVGRAEHTNTCPSPILHAHAQAKAHGRDSAHQEHHTENDPRDGSAPGTHRHTHIHTVSHPVKCDDWQLSMSASTQTDCSMWCNSVRRWVGVWQSVYGVFCEEQCVNWLYKIKTCARLSESSYVTIKSCVFIGKD